MDRLVLIDGHAVIHRAYHAYPALTTSKGELINAVYGFASILLTSLKQLEPKYVAVAFDKKGPTFRHKEYKKYKAHRPKVDKELIDQIERVHEVVKTLNIPIFEKDGFEGDDIIGTLAKQATGKHEKHPRGGVCPPAGGAHLGGEKPQDLEIIIVTGDHDALQLVNNKVRVFMPARGKKPALMFDRKEFLKKYGFEPIQLIDYKALAGDQSDGIPGVKGIGQKTATNLIVKFGSIEEIYKNFKHDLDLPSQVAEKLIKSKKQAQLSKRLATIITNVPIKLNLKKCRLLDYDKDKVVKLFEELEFRTLISKLPQKWEELITKKAVNPESKVDDNNQMELFVS